MHEIDVFQHPCQGCKVDKPIVYIETYSSHKGIVGKHYCVTCAPTKQNDIKPDKCIVVHNGAFEEEQTKG